MNRKSTVTSIAIILLALIANCVAGGRETNSDEELRRLLLGLHANDNSPELAALFRIGDERIDELVKALSDSDPKIKLNAQMTIRYLGNEKGIKALVEAYKKDRTTNVTLPIPLPLNDWDYDFVRTHYMVGKRLTEPMMDSYLFALLLDGTPRAASVFRKIIDNARTHGVKMDESRYTCLPGSVINDDTRFEQAVLSNACFLNERERRLARSRLVSYNTAGDKALVEIEINGGFLAKEWYHVVLSKSEKGWRFFSVSLIGWS